MPRTNRLGQSTKKKKWKKRARPVEDEQARKRRKLEREAEEAELGVDADGTTYDRLLLSLRDDPDARMQKSSSANVDSILSMLQASGEEETTEQREMEGDDDDSENSVDESEAGDEDMAESGAEEDGEDEEDEEDAEEDEDEDEEHSDGEEFSGDGYDWFAARFAHQLTIEDIRLLDDASSALHSWAIDKELATATCLPAHGADTVVQVTAGTGVDDSPSVRDTWLTCCKVLGCMEEDGTVRGKKADYQRLFAAVEASSGKSPMPVNMSVKAKLLEKFIALVGSQARKAKALSAKSKTIDDDEELAELLGKMGQIVPLRGKKPLMTFAESLSIFSTYTDAMLVTPSMMDTPQLPPSLAAALFHSANHVLKSRDLVNKHTQRLKQLKAKGRQIIEERKALLAPLDDMPDKSFEAKKQKRYKRKQLTESEAMLQLEKREAELRDQERLMEDTTRDQGFTSARVLIITPMQEAGAQIAQHLMSLLPHKQVHRQAKFNDEFADPDRDLAKNTAKPKDWNATFYGNTNDNFCMGMQVTKQSMKLYADYFTSDIIIASPLGLRMRIENPSMDEGEHDFLSSIEVLVLHQADVYHMQNWEHMEYIFARLNKVPVKPRSTDFSRVRPYFLEGWAKNYRQTIVTTARLTPELNSAFARHCANWKGRVRVQTKAEGVVSQVVGQVQQLFERIPCVNLADINEVRFQHFKTDVLPKLRSSVQGHTLIFIPSYFDYVRVRNLFKDENVSCVTLADYTPRDEVSRARSWFYHGEVPFMLFTERFHFFHRYKIRGIRSLVFYALPMYEQFYQELVNMADSAEGTSVSYFISPYDKLILERVVGSARCKRMLKSVKKSHLLVSA